MNTRNDVPQRFRTIAAAVLVCAVSLGAPANSQKQSESAGTAASDRPCGQSAKGKPQRGTRSVGKASGPIKFISPARFKARDGQVVAVSLTMQATENIAHLQAQATTDGALEFTDSHSDTSFNAIDAGDEVTLSYAVLPQGAGLNYVNVIITTDSAQGIRMTSYSIPVEVGDIHHTSTAKRASKVVVADDGAVLEVMSVGEGNPAPRPR